MDFGLCTNKVNNFLLNHLLSEMLFHLNGFTVTQIKYKNIESNAGTVKIISGAHFRCH